MTTDRTMRAMDGAVGLAPSTCVALREQLPIREIARRTGLSRNTIRKHLKSGAVEPKFATPERPSKLDPFAEKLAGLMKTEAAKDRKLHRTAKQLHADLVALRFTGSYGRVSALAREWRAGRQREEQTEGHGTSAPLIFRAGEAFQFDWSEEGEHRRRHPKKEEGPSQLDTRLSPTDQYPAGSLLSGNPG